LRHEVERLVALGPLPDEEADASRIEQFQRALEAIAAPVSTEEAERLITVFGPDDCFGLAWTLLHLIESAPKSPIRAAPASGANEWIRRLWESAHP
jgi:hypothetical protein